MTAELDLLLRAAALLRERAEAANTDDARRPYGDRRLDPVPESGWPGLVDNYLGGPIGAHCAALTPAVALELADCLEAGANPESLRTREPMVAIARVYLGEEGLAA